MGWVGLLAHLLLTIRPNYLVWRCFPDQGSLSWLWYSSDTARNWCCHSPCLSSVNQEESSQDVPTNASLGYFLRPGTCFSFTKILKYLCQGERVFFFYIYSLFLLLAAKVDVMENRHFPRKKSLDTAYSLTPAHFGLAQPKVSVWILPTHRTILLAQDYETCLSISRGLLGDSNVYKNVTDLHKSGKVNRQ